MNLQNMYTEKHKSVMQGKKGHCKVAECFIVDNWNSYHVSDFISGGDVLIRLIS